MRKTPPLADHHRYEPAALSRRLAILRKYLRVSTGEMAELLDVSERAYRDWEAGRRKWTTTEMSRKIADATDVSYAWLLFGGYSGQPVTRIAFGNDGKPLDPNGNPPAGRPSGRPFSLAQVWNRTASFAFSHRSRRKAEPADPWLDSAAPKGGPGGPDSGT